MRFRRCREGLAVLFIAFGIQSAGAQVDDYLNQFSSLYPTSWDQCRRENLPSYGSFESASDESASCLRQVPAGDRYVTYRLCDHPGPQSCSSIGNRRCQLATKISAEAQLCSERMVEYQNRQAAFQRAEAARQSAEASAASDALRQRSSAFEMAQRAISRGDVRQANTILNRYIDPNDPTRAPAQLSRDGRMVAGMLGVSTSPAMQLQGHMQTIGLNAFRDMTGNVVRQLDGAAGSGAFNVDQGDGASGNNAIAQATPLAGGGYGDSNFTPELVAAMSEVWQSGDVMGRILVATAIVAQIAAIYEGTPAQSTGVSSRPSLVDGPFARNILRLSESAARGDIRLGQGVDVYTARAEIVETEIAHERRVADARQSVAEDRARREVEADAREAEEAMARAAAEAASGSEPLGSIIRAPSLQTSGEADHCLQRVSRLNNSGEIFYLDENFCDRRIWCEFSREWDPTEVIRHFMDPGDLHIVSNRSNCTYEY